MYAVVGSFLALNVGFVLGCWWATRRHHTHAAAAERSAIDLRDGESAPVLHLSPRARIAHRGGR